MEVEVTHAIIYGRGKLFIVRTLCHQVTKVDCVDILPLQSSGDELWHRYDTSIQVIYQIIKIKSPPDV